jgi:hypothetical protein
MRDEIKAESRIQNSGVRRKEEPPRCASEPFILNSGFWLLTSAVHPSSLIPHPCNMNAPPDRKIWVKASMI